MTTTPPIDEDTPINTLSSNPNLPPDDPEDDVPDFLFLTSLTSSSAKIPKRGEKDFEPHNTRAQDAVLERSREAMHEALSYVRVHTNIKNTCRAWYFGEGVEGREEFLKESVRGRVEAGYCVMVEEAKGPMFKCMGKAPKGRDSRSVWLLAEEALYLVERGGLDLYWPGDVQAMCRGEYQALGAEGEEDEEKADIPLSLQAAWALLVGEDDINKVSLEKYTVYAALKRNGYAVLRADGYELPTQPAPTFMETFSKLFSNYFTRKPMVNFSLTGPLITQGLYRSHAQIYNHLALIPHHTPTPTPSPSTPIAPYSLSYLIYKTSRLSTFQKSAPGTPDFYIAIVDANTGVPAMQALTALLESTPWDPPTRKQWQGDGKRYVRIRHGWRNVVLAVVDSGIASFLRIAEGGMGEERLWERFDRGESGRGGKGGGRGRGGRGRGGRGRGR